MKMRGEHVKGYFTLLLICIGICIVTATSDSESLSVLHDISMPMFNTEGMKDYLEHDPALPDWANANLHNSEHDNSAPVPPEFPSFAEQSNVAHYLDPLLSAEPQAAYASDSNVGNARGDYVPHVLIDNTGESFSIPMTATPAERERLLAAHRAELEVERMRYMDNTNIQALEMQSVAMQAAQAKVNQLQQQEIQSESEAEADAESEQESESEMEEGEDFHSLVPQTLGDPHIIAEHHILPPEDEMYANEPQYPSPLDTAAVELETFVPAPSRATLASRLRAAQKLKQQAQQESENEMENESETEQEMENEDSPSLMETQSMAQTESRTQAQAQQRSGSKWGPPQFLTPHQQERKKRWKNPDKFRKKFYKNYRRYMKKMGRIAFVEDRRAEHRRAMLRRGNVLSRYAPEMSRGGQLGSPYPRMGVYTVPWDKTVYNAQSGQAVGSRVPATPAGMAPQAIHQRMTADRMRKLSSNPNSFLQRKATTTVRKTNNAAQASRFQQIHKKAVAKEEGDAEATAPEAEAETKAEEPAAAAESDDAKVAKKGKKGLKNAFDHTQWNKFTSAAYKNSHPTSVVRPVLNAAAAQFLVRPQSPMNPLVNAATMQYSFPRNNFYDLAMGARMPYPSFPASARNNPIAPLPLPGRFGGAAMPAGAAGMMRGAPRVIDAGSIPLPSAGTGTPFHTRQLPPVASSFPPTTVFSSRPVDPYRVPSVPGGLNAAQAKYMPLADIYKAIPKPNAAPKLDAPPAEATEKAEGEAAEGGEAAAEGEAEASF